MTETASSTGLNHQLRAAQDLIERSFAWPRIQARADDGEILARGENVSAGYKRAGGVQSSEDRAWLPTGDVGELDAEGNLRFSRPEERRNRHAGWPQRLLPEDLEQALRNQPNVKDCVVIPMNRGGNAEPCAVLQAADDHGSRDGDNQRRSRRQSRRNPQSTRTNQRSILRQPKTRTPCGISTRAHMDCLA